MPSLFDLSLVLLCSYVAGATPFGYFAGKWKGIDIREHGSGNIGATNVIRVLGKKVGVPVFILDLLKGFLPVLLAEKWCAAHGHSGEAAAITAALGSVLGHNFTFWLGFKGGKGVATSAGALLAVLPMAVAVALPVWVVLFYTTRYVAVASIAAGVSLPFTVLAQRALSGDGTPGPPLLALATIIGGMAVWRHRSNIRRLLNGTENRFSRRSKTLS